MTGGSLLRGQVRRHGHPRNRLGASMRTPRVNAAVPTCECSRQRPSLAPDGGTKAGTPSQFQRAHPGPLRGGAADAGPAGPLGRWNHPAIALDGSRCGYDLAPLVEKAAELNAELDRFFDDYKLARHEARRSPSRERAEQARAVARRSPLILTKKTGEPDSGVTP